MTSLFPEVDEEIKEIKKDYAVWVDQLIGTTEPYCPSNGTEGAMFYESFCVDCTHDNGDEKLCDIYTDFAFKGTHDKIRKYPDGSIECFGASGVHAELSKRFHSERRKA